MEAVWLHPGVGFGKIGYILMEMAKDYHSASPNSADHLHLNQVPVFPLRYNERAIPALSKAPIGYSPVPFNTTFFSFTVLFPLAVP